MIPKLLAGFPFDIKTWAAALLVLGLSGIFYALFRRALTHLGVRGALALPVVRTLKIFLRWFFFAITSLLILQTLGVLANVWAALLAIMAMVAIGFFALWSVLSNTLCTLLILVYKPFRIGDWVELPADQLAGEAIDLNLCYTTLKGRDNLFIQIPNNTFFQKPFCRKPGQASISLYDQLNKDEPTISPG